MRLEELEEKLMDIDLFWDDTSTIPTREAAICYARNDIGFLRSEVQALQKKIEVAEKALDRAHGRMINAIIYSPKGNRMSEMLETIAMPEIKEALAKLREEKHD